MAIIKHYCTNEAASKLVRTAPRGTRFCMHIRIDTPIAAPGTHPENDRFQDGAQGHVEITRKEAQAMIDRGMIHSSLERQGARLPMTVRENIIWIG